MEPFRQEQYRHDASDRPPIDSFGLGRDPFIRDWHPGPLDYRGAARTEEQGRASDSDDEGVLIDRKASEKIYLSGWRLKVAGAGMLSSLAMICMEATIVGSSIVPITTELRNFDISSWVFSAYLMTFSSFLLIFAKLSDIVGRKLVLLSCLALFLLFSLGCGFAQSMIQLIVCRAFQGLGASGVYAVNITMTPELAAPKWLAWVITLNSVTNIMMLVLGLVFGGLISGHTTWRWIFWSMTPISFVSWTLLYVSLPNSFPDLGTSEHSIYASINPRQLFARALGAGWRTFDTYGALLLLSTTLPFLFAIEEGSSDNFGWASPPVLAGFIVSVVAVSLLIWHEVRLGRRFERGDTAREPILSRTVFGARAICFILIFAFFTGLPFYTLLFTLPERFQIVNFDTPVQSAVHLLPFVAVIPLHLIITYITIRFQIPVLASLFFFGIALFLLGISLLTTSPLTFTTRDYVFQAIAGFGSGPCLGIAISYTCNLTRREKPSERSYAIAMGTFLQARTMGGAVGSALAAVILKQKVGIFLASPAGGLHWSPRQKQILQFTPVLISEFDEVQRMQAQRLFGDIFSTDLAMAAGAAGLAALALVGCYEKKWMRNGRKANDIG